MTSLTILCNTFFPSHCLCCGSTGETICSRCYSHFIRFLPHCYVCGRLNSGHLPHSKCLSDKGLIHASYVYWRINSYTKKVRNRIYNNSTYRSLNDLACMGEGILRKSLFFSKLNGASLLPCPTPEKVFRRRGFRASEIVCSQLSSSLNLPLLKYDGVKNVEKILIVNDILWVKRLERFARTIRKRNPDAQILSLALFRAESIHKVRDMHPVDT